MPPVSQHFSLVHLSDLLKLSKGVVVSQQKHAFSLLGLGSWHTLSSLREKGQCCSLSCLNDKRLENTQLLAVSGQTFVARMLFLV